MSKRQRRRIQARHARPQPRESWREYERRVRRVLRQAGYNSDHHETKCLNWTDRKGRQRHFYPDFCLPDRIYVEISSVAQRNAKSKRQKVRAVALQNPDARIVLIELPDLQLIAKDWRHIRVVMDRQLRPARPPAVKLAA